MHIKLIKNSEDRVFFILLNCRITTFIRHFRLFSKRCPNCNGFKENGKKHSTDDCTETLLKKARRKIIIINFNVTLDNEQILPPPPVRPNIPSTGIICKDGI